MKNLQSKSSKKLILHKNNLLFRDYEEKQKKLFQAKVAVALAQHEFLLSAEKLRKAIDNTDQTGYNSNSPQTGETNERRS